MISKKNKLKCRYCGSDNLYFEEQIVTRYMISEDENGIIVYENGDLFDDKVVEEFTCYRCDDCDRKLFIDNEYSSYLVVTEQNLEEYRQKYCSVETIKQTQDCEASKPRIIDKNKYAYKYDNGLWYENMETSWGGVCPKCGFSDNIIYHIYRNHWNACHDCKIRWQLGSNLFSAWKEMDEEDFRANYEMLKDYEDAEDIYAASPIEDE